MLLFFFLLTSFHIATTDVGMDAQVVEVFSKCGILKEVV